MSLLNQATQLMIDQIDTVQCSFGYPPFTQVYTYKAKKGMYKPGDLAVVKRGTSYKVVMVVSIDPLPVIDPSAPYDYQWLVQRIDLTDYDKAVAAEQTLVDYLAKVQEPKPKSI